MPNDRWSDEEIENLLRDFPKIQDDRPKAAVYKKLAEPKSVPKQPKRWLPLLVAIVAFFSISALVVSLLQESGSNSTSGGTEGGDSQSTAITDEAQTEEAEENEKSSEAVNGTSKEAEADSANTEAARTAVYEEDLEKASVFRIGLAYQAYVVPVSFIIPDQQIDSATATSLDLYEQFAEQIDENRLGFDEYHPYAGEFSRSDSSISHVLPDDHPYDQGSASTLLYFQSMEETFMDQQEIRFLNEQGEAARFSHIGTAEPIAPGEQGQSFYLLSNASDELYLAPAYGLSEANAEDALVALRESPNDDYRTPVPAGLGYSVETDGDTVSVSFNEPMDLTELDELEAMHLIESMALTAQSYGKSLTLSNMVQSEWGGFDFTEALELPAAPNRIDWPEK
ncbi:MAG: hypothetical protein ACQEV0_06160 [Bacillota bacterium]